MATNFIQRLILQQHRMCLQVSLLGSKNAMSTYAPYYVQPVFDKNKVNELYHSEEMENLRNFPVKPPLTYESSSVYFDAITSKFTNYVMEKGNKKLARSLVEKTFELIKRTQIEKYHLAKTQEEKDAIELNPKVILHKAILNTQPLLELSPIKRGGATYQVPIPITDKRSRFYAQRWLLQAAIDRDRSHVRLPDQLARELLDAAANRGRVVKQKQDLHKQCEANRAYAHYRWG